MRGVSTGSSAVDLILTHNFVVAVSLISKISENIVTNDLQNSANRLAEKSRRNFSNENNFFITYN